MFQYKIVLIYILILPVFSRMNKAGTVQKIAIGVLALILPFLFLNEVQESLSMDCVMALLFAYALVRITGKREHDLFGYYDIAVALLCLTLMKTISIIFTAIALATWFFFVVFGDRKDIRREIISIFGTELLSLAAYTSWKRFCSANGNSTYLSDRLNSNIANGTIVPDYAARTIKEMVKSLWNMHLNLGPTGLSVVGIMLIALVLLVVLRYCGELSRQDVAASGIILLGFIGFFAVLCYTFVFVFEKWEADSLSSLDRYLGTYALAICYVVMYRFSLIPGFSGSGRESAEQRDSQEFKAPGQERVRRVITYVAFPAAVLIMFATLPFADLADNIVPGRYIPSHINTYNGLVEVKDELSAMDIRSMGNGYVVVVHCEENSVYQRGMDYEFIPLVARPYNVTNFDEADRDAELTDRINTYEPDFIYFSAHERQYEDVLVYTIPENYDAVDGVDGLYRKRT